MPSEELQHRYPKNIGAKVGPYELFQVQLVTLGQFAEHGILPSKSYGSLSTQKCDALIISRTPVLRAMIVGEDKATGKITKSNWQKLAEDLLTTKILPTGALFGYLTDGSRTIWIAGGRAAVMPITREDGKPMPDFINFKDKAFVSELLYIITNYDEKTGVVRQPASVNPSQLARSIWQTIWRLKGPTRRLPCNIRRAFPVQISQRPRAAEKEQGRARRLNRVPAGSGPEALLRLLLVHGAPVHQGAVSSRP